MPASLPLVPAWRRRCMQTSGIGQGLLGLVLALGEYMDAAGRCTVSNARLAEDCKVDVRTIRRQLRHLQRAGLLGVDTARGGRAVNRYQARPWEDTGVRVARTPVSGLGGHERPGSPDISRPLPRTPVSSELGSSERPFARVREAPPAGWVEEDDAAIAAEFAARAERAAQVKVTNGGEGYGDPDAAQLARDAAAEVRRRVAGHHAEHAQ